MLNEQIIMAGFGGQGVMSMGQLLAYAGMLEGKDVSWLPSYGPEMRGGTANCSVIVSDTPVGSPIVTEATAVIAMNRPSLDKFEPVLKTDGLLLINSSLIDRKANRNDVKVLEIPANEIANELGSGKVANMVVLGAYLEASKALKIDSVMEALKKVFGPSKEHLLPTNKAALERGAEIAKNLK
ncbi:MAG: 2-oxoglutarate/2-oxoacid ferredoxin oxidoreductase, gamma subunit [Firmicutes bacterium]|nr:2-oxoglutarate/2-oxoacid ferredoxin oxidoreductase, gamma subunit [Bacillota bacterium]MDI6706343.1 2-oxoacid:acceptor oxidoreductase family protein [Bacillota bacterium]